LEEVSTSCGSAWVAIEFELSPRSIKVDPRLNSIRNDNHYFDLVNRVALQSYVP